MQGERIKAHSVGRGRIWFLENCEILIAPGLSRIAPGLSRRSALPGLLANPWLTRSSCPQQWWSTSTAEQLFSTWNPISRYPHLRAIAWPPEAVPTSQPYTTPILPSLSHHAIIARQSFTSAIVESMATGSKQLVVEVQVNSALDLDLENSRRLRRTLIAAHNATELVKEVAARDTLQSTATKRTDNRLTAADLRKVNLAPSFNPNFRALVALTDVKIEFTVSVPVRLNPDAGDAESIKAYAISDYDAAATGSGTGKSFSVALSESSLPPPLSVVSVAASDDPDFEVQQEESTANPMLTIEVKFGNPFHAILHKWFACDVVSFMFQVEEPMNLR